MPSRSTTTATPLLTLAEAADHLGVSVRTVRRRVADGSLPAFRVGTGALIRVSAGDLDRLLRLIPAARTRTPEGVSDDARRLGHLDGQVVGVRSVELTEGPLGAPAGVAVVDEGPATMIVPNSLRARLDGDER